jgi:uncharacterized protein YcfJ
MWRTNRVLSSVPNCRRIGNPRRGPLAAAVALAAMIASPVAGQTVATSFEQLQFMLKAGDTIYVTEGSGEPEQKARVLELSASTLSKSIEGVRRDLLESDVKRIRQRRPDSRKNGALIGSLVGAAASTGAAKALESPAGSCGGGCVGKNILHGGGLGALVGLGVDALIQGRRDIYSGCGSRSSGEIVMRGFEVPGPILAQGSSANAIVDIGADRSSSIAPSAAGRWSLPALPHRTEEFGGLTGFEAYRGFEWLQHRARRERGNVLLQPPTPEDRSWIGRHPALFGALVGTGAGAVSAGTMENELFCSGGDDDCIFHGGGRMIVGAGIGAGVGAVVGWLAGRGAR